VAGDHQLHQTICDTDRFNDILQYFAQVVYQVSLPVRTNDLFKALNALQQKYLSF